MRTTNGAESYYSHFNNQFYDFHPNIYLTLDLDDLISMRLNTQLKISEINKGGKIF